MSARFKHRTMLFGLVIATITAVASGAATAADDASSGEAAVTPQIGTQPRAEINFVNHGGIRNWRADKDDALYIEAQNRTWYKATFFGSCTGLGFANSIGFVSDATGSLDKFGSIVVRAPGGGVQECNFRTLTEVPGPPEPVKR